MNVRFAEECRDNPLMLEPVENVISRRSIEDGRTQAQRLLTCEQDIYLGIFFDGTNNNKFRDTPGFGHSNVARLYEAYPGTHTAQTAPSLLPAVDPVTGNKIPRPVFKDEAYQPDSVPAQEFPYYRKIYIPGVGTPMPDVGDAGLGTQRTLGLAMAALGQVRLDWAMLQLVNQVHAAVFKRPLEASIDFNKLWEKRRPAPPPRTPLADLTPEIRRRFEELIGLFKDDERIDLLTDLEARLKESLARRSGTLPRLRKIRVSVFGFSRGATAARAFVSTPMPDVGDVDFNATIRATITPRFSAGEIECLVA